MTVSHMWEGKTGISEADSVMRVMDGNVALIAGWIRPAPSTAKPDGHAELVVLLQPTVVKPGTLTAGHRD
jgi:hypothetical protein